jgi:hypothetical protein
MKKIVIQWAEQKSNDSGKQSRRLVGASHPGCCKQDGGCGKKHGH